MGEGYEGAVSKQPILPSNVDELKEEVLGWAGPALVGWLRVAGGI